MFSFYIVLLVILFPIKLLTQKLEIGFKVRIEMRIINYPFNSPVNSKFKT